MYVYTNKSNYSQTSLLTTNNQMHQLHIVASLIVDSRDFTSSPCTSLYLIYRLASLVLHYLNVLVYMVSVR